MKYFGFFLSAGYLASAVFSQSNPAPIVSITGPLANAVYKAGSEARITWTQPTVSTIPQIVLAQGPPTALQPIMTIATNLDAKSGSCTWKIPSDLPSGSNYALELGVSPDIAYTGQFTIENEGNGALVSQNSTSSTNSSTPGLTISLSPSNSVMSSSMVSASLPTSNSSTIASATSTANSKIILSTPSASSASTTRSPNGANNPHFASSASKLSSISYSGAALGMAMLFAFKQLF